MRVRRTKYNSQQKQMQVELESNTSETLYYNVRFEQILDISCMYSDFFFRMQLLTTALTCQF